MRGRRTTFASRHKSRQKQNAVFLTGRRLDLARVRSANSMIAFGLHALRFAPERAANVRRVAARLLLWGWLRTGLLRRLPILLRSAMAALLPRSAGVLLRPAASRLSTALRRPAAILPAVSAIAAIAAISAAIAVISAWPTIIVITRTSAAVISPTTFDHHARLRDCNRGIVVTRRVAARVRLIGRGGRSVTPVCVSRRSIRVHGAARDEERRSNQQSRDNKFHNFDD